MLRQGTVPAIDDRAYAEMFEQEDVHWWFRGRRAVIWALLAQIDIARSSSILDAGCGTGRNLVEFGELASCVGIDPSPDAVSFCQDRGLLNVTEATLADLPFEDEKFDVLFAFDVLEHIDDDVGALRELHRVARCQSSLLITVPAHQWMWSSHDVQLHHVRRYGRSELFKNLELSGWKVRYATYFNTFYFPFAGLARLVSKVLPRNEHTDLDRSPKWLNRVLLQPFRLEAVWIRAKRRLPFGVSIGVICDRGS